MTDVLFFGAGASKPFGIPTMTEFPDVIETDLKNGDRSLFQDIRQTLKRFSVTEDLEVILSVLGEFNSAGKAESISPSILYRYRREIQLATNNVDSQLIDQIGSLKEKVLESIVAKCSVSNPEKIYDTYDLFFTTLSALYSRQVTALLSGENFDIFTTNYDTCIETYFDKARYEKKQDQISLDDGVSQIDRRHWSPQDYSRSNRNRLYKLHGSIDMDVTDRGITKFSGPLGALGERRINKLMIFPAAGKFVFEDPFFWMLSTLRASLMSAGKVVVVGYSFRDPAVKSIFKSVTRTRADLSARGSGNPLRTYFLGPTTPRIHKDEFDSDEGFVPVLGKFDESADIEKLVSTIKEHG